MNGDPITERNDDAFWDGDANQTEGAWGFGFNDPLHGDIHGLLYNHLVVEDLRNICPSGWNVPSWNDFVKMSNHFGGLDQLGMQMKSDDQVFGWDSNSIHHDNTGFRALRSGVRAFGTVIDRTDWNIRLPLLAVTLTTSRALELQTMANNPNYGRSIRCIKNSE